MPDILTFGKSIGNGFPIAAVVTSRDIANSLPEYMNTVSLINRNAFPCCIKHFKCLFFSMVAILWRAQLVKQFWK